VRGRCWSNTQGPPPVARSHPSIHLSHSPSIKPLSDACRALLRQGRCETGRCPCAISGTRPSQTEAGIRGYLRYWCVLHDTNESRRVRLILADVHEYTRGATLIATGVHPLTAQSLPVTLGHEISGVVDAIGPGVRNRSVGDRVAIQPILSDGDCDACEQGRPNCCLRQGFYGLSASIILGRQYTTDG
jgi:hypothetical protein